MLPAPQECNTECKRHYCQCHKQPLIAPIPGSTGLVGRIGGGPSCAAACGIWIFPFYFQGVGAIPYVADRSTGVAPLIRLLADRDPEGEQSEQAGRDADEQQESSAVSAG